MYNYHVSSSQIFCKIRVSNEGKLLEFSAYWIMRNKVKFMLRNLGLLKKLSAFAFLIFSRIIRYALWINNKRKLIVAQIMGIIDGIKEVFIYDKD